MEYKVICMDVPWLYHGGYNSRKIKIKPPYPTMSIHELASLPIKQLADKDCALFMWATGPKMNEAVELIDIWGFRFITIPFVWIKTNEQANTVRYTPAYWTMANAEYLLLAKRGRPRRNKMDVKQVIFAPIGKRHSAKPPVFRERIIELVKDAPRIELFARTKAPGWDAVGNEIDGLDIRVALERIFKNNNVA